MNYIEQFTMIGALGTLIGVTIALIGVIIAIKQLRQVNRNVKNLYSPLLIVDTSELGGQNPIRFSSSCGDYPVVQSVYLRLVNDGNGPALNINVKVKQGNLEIERVGAYHFISREIHAREVRRNSLARGETLQCFFRVRAGFIPPQEGEPLMIEATCEDMYGRRGCFYFDAPMDMFSALADRSQTFIFRQMKWEE